MKTTSYISSFRRWLLILSAGAFLWGCQLKEEPIEHIYKAKPQKAPPAKSIPEDKITLPDSSGSDSIITPEKVIPLDSTSKSIQDTTETLQQIEKKPEIRTYRKLYLYNLHKKPLIS